MFLDGLAQAGRHVARCDGAQIGGRHGAEQGHDGQADALPALPVPPAAPGEPIRPAIRLRPLDEPATATLVFEAYFPAMPPNGAPDPGWARIAFPLADGRSMPEARSLFGAEYILKQSDAAWIGGRWTGRLHCPA